MADKAAVGKDTAAVGKGRAAVSKDRAAVGKDRVAVGTHLHVHPTALLGYIFHHLRNACIRQSLLPSDE